MIRMIRDWLVMTSPALWLAELGSRVKQRQVDMIINDSRPISAKQGRSTND